MIGKSKCFRYLRPLRGFYDQNMTTKLKLTTAAPDIDADDHLGFLIHEVARALTAAYGTAMKSLGLTRPQVRVVAYVDQYPGITQAKLRYRFGN